MSQDKRLFILEKAIELFSVHGFEAVSIQDITNYCGISKGAFYLSFKSKDELMIALFEHLLSAISLIFDRAVNSKSDPQIRLLLMYEELLGFMRINRGLAMFFVHEHLLLQHKNKDVFCILLKYEKEQRSILRQLLDSIYGEQVTPFIEDLILSLSSLIKTYFEYICLKHLDVDNKRLAQSLVEKTNILARAQYHYAIPNYVFHQLENHLHLSTDDLHQFNLRLVKECTLRANDEMQAVLKLALIQLASLLEQQKLSQSDIATVYAYSALLNDQPAYEELSLRLRSYIKIKFPQ